MKRVTFATAEELRSYCQSEQLSLVIEYRDEQQKQRQVILQGDTLAQLETYLALADAMAYYRKDGIFHEVVAAWLKK
jgi:hypothetical protein